uniref:Phosphatidylinositol 5-phosphate 4-kinase type-2 alpha-like isoform X1 n=1 Tax=Crassostrea virginica TaxID=6565 RepID=A0A8B8C0N6_CRAVI|nr:phosphatidylinositol 5-phosphate 4-kinase type-2 alpha-like isoform X1 [Crassostrea virginica]
MATTKDCKHKRKQLKLKAVPQKTKLFRASEPLLSVFMWGINHTINTLNHVNIPVMLMPDDFKAFSKVHVDYHKFQNPWAARGGSFLSAEAFPVSWILYHYIELGRKPYICGRDRAAMTDVNIT